MRGKGSLDLDSLHFPFQFSTLRDIAESNFQVSYDKGKESSIVAFPHPFLMGFLETVVLVPPTLPADNTWHSIPKKPTISNYPWSLDGEREMTSFFLFL